ncbi:MAG: ABC transporter permease [Candidatus Promineifilaceae bacterium]
MGTKLSVWLEVVKRWFARYTAVYMPIFGRILTAFFIRELYTELSYRTAFLLNFTGVIVSTLSFFFISQLIGQSETAGLAEYGGDYFSFVIIGIALASYFTLGLGSFATGLRNAQVTGTLEAMLMTPAPLSAVVVGSALWSYVYETVRVSIYLLLGLLLGVRFQIGNPLAVLLILLLTIGSGASIGIFAASIIMIIKRGNPITTFVGSITTLAGGVWYPIDILPEWLQTLSAVIPLTYALNAMRSVLLLGAGWSELWSDLLALFLFFVVLFPLSLLMFRVGVARARQEGSLAHY